MSDETTTTSPTPKPEATKKRPAFPIVGVGASAGGLAPTVELLANLGVEPGLAVVVVHHLDPKHESGLVDILSRATAMPVGAVRDGVRVERNRVYVVPPNAGVLINQGILALVPRPNVALHLPIDQFFESLAVDQAFLAVGVVLSGAGFDGTAGIRAIKREGGIGLAQDATAQYVSMPQSAIATGSIEFILPPARIARELVRIGEHVPETIASVRREPEEPDYAQILALVRKSTGIDFASYKLSTIRRRMQRRLLIRGVRELGEYAELLQREPEEITTLCEDMLIHVTGFFREPEVFDALRTTVFPKLLADRPRDLPLRIWVPGCSTGEEVYSIAMCLLEYLEDAHRADVPIKIFGTDLSLATIEKARVGRYPESIEPEVSQGRLQRFFTQDLGAYQIRRVCGAGDRRER
jgi:two-component system CheB/CheR fusion protein